MTCFDQKQFSKFSVVYYKKCYPVNTFEFNKLFILNWFLNSTFYFYLLLHFIVNILLLPLSYILSMFSFWLILYAFVISNSNRLNSFYTKNWYQFVLVTFSPWTSIDFIIISIFFQLMVFLTTLIRLFSLKLLPSYD